VVDEEAERHHKRIECHHTIYKVPAHPWQSYVERDQHATAVLRFCQHSFVATRAAVQSSRLG
jgi:hypothetical protein